MDLDDTFNSSGIVTTNIGGSEESRSAFLQTNGKLVLAGYSNGTGEYDFALVRYNADGSLDTSFDTDGKVITDIGNDDQANFVVVQTDGKIVVAGYSESAGDYDFALVRYNADGSLDTSFDTDGKVITDVSEYDEVKSVVVQTNGKIVVAGYSEFGGFYDFVLVRYNSDGSLDTSFDTDGIVITNIGAWDQANSVALQTDGKIVVAGNSDGDFALVRYNADGSLDTSFNTDGILIADIGAVNDSAISVTLQSDGKILVAGESGSSGAYVFALARYSTNGLPDLSFDVDGVKTTTIGNNGYDFSRAVLVQSDGKIILAGTSFNGSNYDFAIARYGPASPAFTLSSSSESRTVNNELSGYSISSTGGAIDSYSVSPAAPSGLTFNTSTGLLTGTPTSVAAATTYTITATNEMSTTTQTFTLTVTAANPSSSNNNSGVSEELARQEAAREEAARRAKAQKELTELLSLIPAIGELALNIGKATKSINQSKCVKGKTVRFVKKGKPCPRGFARAR